MRCSKCGKLLTNEMCTVNGIPFCLDCAREAGYTAGLNNIGMQSDMLKGLFGSDLTSTVMPLMNELEFASSREQIKCPKCGTTLRDIEANGMLGCIECYNTFNESIMRALLKNQANTQYMGRKPGEASEFSATGFEKTSGNKVVDKINDMLGIKKDEKADEPTSENKETENQETAKTANDESQELLVKLEATSDEDIKSVSTEDLNKGIELAVKAEQYKLAARLRDEIKGREGQA